ncbi:hypothetical protein C6496_14385 [Candidatus Poribacteria bacterium]|nr:MAG: hypothetical protein C6496_14385 [Candidatus Poribacteria bacterium]
MQVCAATVCFEKYLDSLLRHVVIFKIVGTYVGCSFVAQTSQFVSANSLYFFEDPYLTEHATAKIA